MAWDDLAAGGVRYTTIPAEGRRLGRSIGRVTCGFDPVGPETARELTETIAQAPDDIVVVRYPAAAVCLGAAVLAAGRDVVPAGALTYWGAAPDHVTRPSGASARDLDVVPAQALDADGAGRAAAVVDEVVADAFAGYGSHYAANPLLDPALVLAGYQEWARGSLTGDGVVLVLRERGTPIGLATCSEGRSDLEVLLAGLVSEYQGGGRYGVLLAACADEATRRGRDRLVISTQVANVRVQRAWANAGLRPFAAVETVHAVRPGLLP
ncbi:MAG: hypothetical protein GEU96_04735 [Propionibacteriales bacterium]|nr:hypothetical protein [Propionibacteriales bacterium]